MKVLLFVADVRVFIHDKLLPPLHEKDSTFKNLLCKTKITENIEKFSEMIPDRFNIYIKKLIEHAPLFEDLGSGASTFEEGISGLTFPDNFNGDFQQPSNGEFFGLTDIAGIETENSGDVSLASSFNLQDETVDGTISDPDISYVESITNVEASVIDVEPEIEMSNIDGVENQNQFRKNGILTNKSSTKKKKNKVILNIAVSSDMRTSRIKMVESEISVIQDGVQEVLNSDAEITVLNADEICVPDYKSVCRGKKRKRNGDLSISLKMEKLKK